MARRRVTTTTCDQCGAEIDRSWMWLGLALRYGDAWSETFSLDFCSEGCRVLWREEHTE